MAVSEQPITVTLVHGTFASKARWIREGSPMADALEAAGIAHEPFVWSGGNSHRARIKAATDLAERLREDKRDGVRQAVVAHSHGGNIAVHAVWRLMNTRDGSIPVVTLATPFLFANLRSLHRMVLVAAGLQAFVTLAVVTGFAIVAPFEGNQADGPWWVLLFFSAMWVVVVVQLVCCVIWMRRHGRPWRRDAQERLIGLVQTPDATDAGLLVVRAAEDEASTSLALAQLTGWLAATAARLSRPQSWMRLYGALAAAGLGMALLSRPDLEEVVYYVLVIGINVAGLLSLALVSAPALLSLSHGADGPTTSLFAFVSAEATPPGRHLVIQRPIRDATKQGLSHSSLYDDEQVLGWVIDHVTS